MTSPANQYAELLRKDFRAFAHRAFLELYPGTRFRQNWHHEVIAAKLEEVRHCQTTRVSINIAPRHLKSHTISVAYVAWLLGHDPTMQIITISYGQELADTFARGCRKLMASPFYQALFDTRISPDRDSVSEFYTTKGGVRFSTSVGGVLTGRGADVIIIDDPLKTDEAISDKRRIDTNSWFDDTVRTRLNNQETGRIVLTMQRVHGDDLVAHVQKHERWDVVALPLVATEKQVFNLETPYGTRRIVRNEGSILQKSLTSPATVARIRATTTAYNFAAQYQQDPQPVAGNIVERAWLKPYSPSDKPERFEQIIQSWDTANKDSELSNFSVCTTWGLKKKHMYLLDVFRQRLNFPQLKSAVELLAKLHNATIVLIEDKASGQSLIQQLRADRFTRVREAPKMDGDKIIRLRSQTAKMSGGFVHVPSEAPWLDDYISELISFPNSKYDDQVDSTVYALQWTIQNHSTYGWNDENLKNFENMVSSMMFHRRLGIPGF